MNHLGLVGLVVMAALLGGCGGAPASLPTPMTGATIPAAENTPLPVATDGVPTQSIPPSPLSPTQESIGPTPTVNIHCTETEPHPIGQSIAETYGASYEEVMTFFCTGVPFEDIVLAYQTAKLAGIDVKEVLTMWYDFGSWDAVWQELGLE